ncbi:hypothetical protein OYC64_000522 [Pagothenia borchgrevinki]|uniref:Uncharacterized protein n=1 Tax=Pagothenia borchgrevinki TaxID=8213 RepID=A0ABD2HES2_PAGBO
MVRVRLSVELHPQHGVRFRRASAVKGEWLQPGEAIAHHATGVVHTSKRTVAASGSVQLIPCQTKKKN